MANDATALLAITHKILSRGIAKLRPRLVMASRAAVDYQADAVKFGDVVNVPLPVDGNPRTVTPGPVPPTPDSKVSATTPIPVDQWYHDDFHLTDKEMGQVDKDEQYVPAGMEAALDGLATQVNQSIWGLNTRVFNFVGDDTADPFPADDNATTAAAAHRVLNEEKVPRANRNMTLGFLDEQHVIQNADFRQFDNAGPAGQMGVVDGIIGRKMGWDWLSDDDAIVSHVTGALTTATVTGANAVGATTINITASAASLNIGDIVNIAGDPTNYACQNDLNATGNLAITPPLRVATSGTEILTVNVALAADHRRNMGWERAALQIVSRVRKIDGEVRDAMKGGAFPTTIVRDPVSGLVFRMQIIREYMQVAWDIDVLWGVGMPQPERAVLITGPAV